jgi:hypothetical protein
MVRNKSHRVHNNIIRDATDAKGSIMALAATRDNRIFKNVIKNMVGVTRVIATREKGPGGTASRVHNNIFCNIDSYRVSASDGLIVDDNTFDARLSSCNAEEQRILIEMQSLPGLSYDGTTVGSAPNPPADVAVIMSE